jgi:exosome complex component RRP46
MTVAAPEADLGILPKADGSATFKYAGYTITASVNGPIEAARRDEHPYKAHVDVIVRPAAGTGGKSFQRHTSSTLCRKIEHCTKHYIGTRERHLESLLESSLSQIILVKDFPRCLIQIVLQLESAPANDYVNTKLVQAGIVRRPSAAPLIRIC